MVCWKLVLVSAAVMFAALGVKVSLPIATANLPLLWSFFLLCFKPPYLFVVLNTIIISIVASSCFHHSNHQSPQPTPPPPVFLPSESPVLQNEEEEEEEEEKRVIEEEGMALKRKESPEKKPPVSARFSQRKFHKSSSGSSSSSEALRVVAKAKRQETLESTWKAITEGRSMPLSRHVKKSETRHNGQPPQDALLLHVGTCKLRKEPSPSQDELNRRVEAFIRKFNQDMRLQRQQSLEQYMQMINRGAA